MYISLGAATTINYRTENLRHAIKALTGGKGPDVIYDLVGSDLAEPAFRSIAWRGRYLVVRLASGTIPELPLNLTLPKGASIVGVFWGGFARQEPKASAAAMAELTRWYAQGKTTPVIDQTLPMTDLIKGSLCLHGLAQRQEETADGEPLAAVTP